MIRTLSVAAALLAASACAPQPDMSAPVGASSAMTRPPATTENVALARVAADPARPAASKERDAFRRPVEALTFWGLRPGMTILEVGPGAGWWTEILAPYAATTGGRYIATGANPADPQIGPERAATSRKTFTDKFVDPRYGQITLVDFGPSTGLAAAPNSVDFALVARAFHNYARNEGFTDKVLADVYRALKPGGILAVEQHRAPEGVMKPETGYVPESYVIQAAERAGFRLDGRSELNANPKDDRDHPFGVWTLQPVRTSEGEGRKLTDAERAEFDAIGESDRMTLRFIKPA